MSLKTDSRYWYLPLPTPLFINIPVFAASFITGKMCMFSPSYFFSRQTTQKNEWHSYFPCLDFFLNTQYTWCKGVKRLSMKWYSLRHHCVCAVIQFWLNKTWYGSHWDWLPMVLNIWSYGNVAVIWYHDTCWYWCVSSSNSKKKKEQKFVSVFYRTSKMPTWTVYAPGLNS